MSTTSRPPPPTALDTGRSIITRGPLTSLQLLEIPAANTHIAPILIHAIREVLEIDRARLGCVLTRSGIRVVGTSLSVVVLSCGGLLVLLWLRLSCLGAPAAEEASDCVADTGADCDAAGEIRLAYIWESTGGVREKRCSFATSALRNETYAAVLAI